MNYCVSDQQTTERCECYRYYDSFSEPVTSKVCEVGQYCLPTGNYPLYTGVQCFDRCQKDQIGPCLCFGGERSYEVTTGAQVCMFATASATYPVPLPVAEFNTLLTRKSACLLTDDVQPRWQACEAGYMCVRSVDSVAKCSGPCPIDSITATECFCMAPDGTSTLALVGKFCAANGYVGEYVDIICRPNSFANGTCKCVESQAACAVGKVCVSSNGTMTCMTACTINYSANAACACRGRTNARVVDLNDKCVITSNGDVADKALPECKDGQIGPCACRDVATTKAPFHYFYTDASSACFTTSSGQQPQVMELAKLGSIARGNAPCQQTVSNPVSAVQCGDGQYCMAIDDTTAMCLSACAPNVFASVQCACAKPDGNTAILAKAGNFCRSDGKVDKLNGQLCYPNSISPGSCKCATNDFAECPINSSCAPISGVQKCQATCGMGTSKVITDCICPFSGSDVLVPAKLVCACANTNAKTYACAALRVCEEDEIGPCACAATQNGANMRRVNSAQACMTVGASKTAVLLCKLGTIVNQPCACRDIRKPALSVAKAIHINYSAACMLKPDGTTDIVLECQPGSMMESACACRTSNGGGAASYCQKGGVCLQDPADATQNVCFQACSEKAPCQAGNSCFGVANSRHCEKTCAVDQIVGAGRGCMCGAEVNTLCSPKSACLQIDALQCVAECNVNVLADKTCYCRRDGTGSTTQIEVAAVTSACVQVNALMQTNGVRPLCTAKRSTDCACQLYSTAPDVVYASANQVCTKTEDGGSMLLNLCTYAAADAVCACVTNGGPVTCKKNHCVTDPLNAMYSLCAGDCDANMQLDQTCICGQQTCVLGQRCISGAKCITKCPMNQISPIKCDCLKNDGVTTKVVLAGQACIKQSDDDYAPLNVCSPHLSQQCACQTDAGLPDVLYTGNAKTCLPIDGGYKQFDICSTMASSEQACACKVVGGFVPCQKNNCIADSANQNQQVCVTQCVSDAHLSQACQCGAQTCFVGQRCSSAGACVDECRPNAVASGDCLCVLTDGVTVTPALEGQACVKRGDDFAVVEVCTQELLKQCACRATKASTDALFTGELQACLPEGSGFRRYDLCSTVLTPADACACQTKSSFVSCAKSHCVTDTAAPTHSICLPSCTAGTEVEQPCVCGSNTCAAKQQCTPAGKCINKCAVDEVLAKTCDCLKKDGVTTEQADGGQACVTLDDGDVGVRRVCTDEVASACACQTNAAENHVVYASERKACLKSAGGFELLDLCTYAAADAVCACEAMSGFVSCAKSMCLADPANQGSSICAKKCEINQPIDKTCTCGESMCAPGQQCISPAKCVTKCPENQIASQICDCVKKNGTTAKALKNQACTQQGDTGDFVPLDVCSSNIAQLCACLVDSERSRVVYTSGTEACVSTDGGYERLQVCSSGSQGSGNCACGTESGFVPCGPQNCVLNQKNLGFHICASKCQVDASVTQPCACGSTACLVGQRCAGGSTCQTVCPDNCVDCVAETQACVKCGTGYELKSGNCAKNGLTAGALAGIVVGCIVVAAGCIAVLIVLLIRRQRKKDEQNQIRARQDVDFAISQAPVIEEQGSICV